MPHQMGVSDCVPYFAPKFDYLISSVRLCQIVPFHREIFLRRKYDIYIYHTACTHHTSVMSHHDLVGYDNSPPRGEGMCTPDMPSLQLGNVALGYNHSMHFFQAKIAKIDTCLSPTHTYIRAFSMDRDSCIGDFHGHLYMSEFHIIVDDRIGCVHYCPCAKFKC